MGKLRKVSECELREALKGDDELSRRFKGYTTKVQKKIIEIGVLISDVFESEEEFNSFFQQHLNEKNHNHAPSKEMCL